MHLPTADCKLQTATSKATRNASATATAAAVPFVFIYIIPEQRVHVTLITTRRCKNAAKLDAFARLSTEMVQMHNAREGRCGRNAPESMQ